jgi:hypothetical protein
LELYGEWHTYWTTSTEDDKLAKDAKIRSSTILAEILRNILSKDNPGMALKFHHANGHVPQDILGVYTYLLVRDHFPHANLDVIVRDIARVTHSDVFTASSEVHNLRCMVQKLYAEN